MALTAQILAPPTTRRSQRNFLQIDRNRPVEVYYITKLSGDTTGSLVTGLARAREVIILDSAGAVIDGAAGTTGSGTVALTGLGSGTVIFVIVRGDRITH